MPCIHPWIPRIIYILSVVLIACIAWASLEDPETFWSPGHLSRHHTDISQCTQCHEPFVGPTRQNCMKCHSLKQFVTQSQGDVGQFHKGVIERKESCITCHSEHKGLRAPISVGLMDNPHGEIIFRVSGARTCSDCHAVEIRENATHITLLKNAKVRHLLHEGEGAHRPGRFAKCLTCHIGGQIDIEDEEEEDEEEDQEEEDDDDDD